MDVIAGIKSLFYALYSILGLQFNFYGYYFTIGQAILGSLIISCSLVLLRYISRGD